LSIELDDLASIEKKVVAGFIPNAIEFVTMTGQKYYFASFIQRDSTYDAIVAAWGGPSRTIRLRTFKRHNDDDDRASVVSMDSTADESSSNNSSGGFNGSLGSLGNLVGGLATAVSAPGSNFDVASSSSSSSSTATSTATETPSVVTAVKAGENNNTPGKNSAGSGSRNASPSKDKNSPDRIMKLADVVVSHQSSPGTGGAGSKSPQVLKAKPLPAIEARDKDGKPVSAIATATSSLGSLSMSSLNFGGGGGNAGVGSLDDPLHASSTLSASAASSAHQTLGYSPPISGGTPIERRLSAASVAFTKGLADLAAESNLGHSNPASPASDDGGGSSLSGGGSGTLGSSSSLGGVGVGLRGNQHIVFQKHPVLQSQFKHEIASRPRSPAVSPDRNSIAGLGRVSHLDLDRDGGVSGGDRRSPKLGSGSAGGSPLDSNGSTVGGEKSPVRPGGASAGSPGKSQAGTTLTAGSVSAASTGTAGSTATPTTTKTRKKKVGHHQKHHVRHSVRHGHHHHHHHPLACPCEADHARMTPVFEATFPVSVPVLWDLLYRCPIGTPSTTHRSSFYFKFMNDKRKCTDVKVSEWFNKDAKIPGGDGPGGDAFPSPKNDVDTVGISHVKDGWHRRVEYVMPLSNPLGPRSTRCQARETIVHVSEEGEGDRVRRGAGYFCVAQSSVTPDVPSGGTFVTHLKACFTRVEERVSRVKVSCEVEFVKFSWLQGVLQAAVPEGMKHYYKELDPFLRDFITDQASKLHDVVVVEEIETSGDGGEDGDDGEYEDDGESETAIEESKDGLAHPLETETEAMERIEKRRLKKLEAESAAVVAAAVAAAAAGNSSAGGALSPRASLASAGVDDGSRLVGLGVAGVGTGVAAMGLGGVGHGEGEVVVRGHVVQSWTGSGEVVIVKFGSREFWRAWECAVRSTLGGGILALVVVVVMVIIVAVIVSMVYALGGSHGGLAVDEGTLRRIVAEVVKEALTGDKSGDKVVEAMRVNDEL
ncbi:hypothetical protein HDU76_008389, partial [Blyttiomyces sp. JEL0837]